MKHQPIPKETIEPGETLQGVLLCPLGSFLTRDGKRRQVCDETAFNKVVEAWKADAREILCDFEHKSETGEIDSDTTAAAWISNLSVNKHGLVGDMKFTDVGAKAVSNRRLRFLSPVWPLDADGRPTRLKSVALTNTPNIEGEPVLNKETPTKERSPSMDKLKQLLGLSAEATDEEVAAKVTKLLEANAKLNKEKEEAEAEDFAEKNKAKIDKAAAKALYLANKAKAVEIVGAIAEPKAPETAPQQVLNKAEAKTPVKSDILAELNKLPAGRERVKFAVAHAKEIAEANK